VVAVAATAPWSVPFAFGASYGRSVPVFQILLPGAGLTTITALMSPYFLGQLLRPGTVSALAWLRLAIAASASALLVRSLAEVGVAIGLVSADLVTTVIAVALYAWAAETSLRQLLIVETGDLAAIAARCFARAQSARAALGVFKIRSARTV
jgi:O-antigen/teichoic acid export membrane protein